MAREKLDVTTVILDNQTYAILHGEFSAIVGERAGARAAQMLDIDGPGIDWLGLAASMGVPASRVTDVDSFITAFEKANRTPGPHLIDAVISA